jgi:hypothetical protein
VGSEHRLRRLRELIARLEQLPASSDSERMLREVRARVVDIDTGVTPRAMLAADRAPTQAAEPAPPAAQKPVRAAPAEAVPRSPAPTPAVGLSVADDREWLSLVATNEILSLDDSAQLSSPGEAQAGQDRRPWTRGLRG